MTSRKETLPAPLELSPAQRALLDERLQRARRVVAQWAQNGGRRPRRAGDPLISARRETLRSQRHALAGGFQPHDHTSTKRALVAVLERSLAGVAPDDANFRPVERTAAKSALAS